MRVSNSLVVISCFCLLAMQAGGMHLHVDEYGRHAATNAVHPHQGSPENHSHHYEFGIVHGHNAEVDVSLPEQPGVTWSKLVPVLIACAIVTILGVRLHQPTPTPTRPTTKVRRRERWRPPLRGPPLPI